MSDRVVIEVPVSADGAGPEHETSSAARQHNERTWFFLRREGGVVTGLGGDFSTRRQSGWGIYVDYRGEPLGPRDVEADHRARRGPD
jgi:hypothetical protein